MLAVVLLDAGPLRLRTSLTGQHDNATFSYPLRVEAARQWLDHRLPLWNPYSLAGSPLLGDITAGALYPGNLPFLIDLDGERYRALDRVAVLHFVLAALFMYVFARALSLGHAAAVVSGLVFAGNGTLLFYTKNWIQTQNAAVWLPLILAALHRAATPGGFWIWTAVGAVAVALQNLAGYPQYVFYTGVMAGAYALVLTFGRRQPRPLLAVAAIYALGAALAAVQLLPTSEIVALSRRGGVVSINEFLALASSPNVLRGLVVPGGAVSPTVGSVVVGGTFVGTLALVLAVEGARSLQRAQLFLSITLLVTFLLAIGPSTPVGWLSYHVPGLNMFRYPFKHLLEVMFCLAGLAGFGVQSLLDGRRGARASLVLTATVVGGWLVHVFARGSRHWALTAAAVSVLIFVVLVLAKRPRAAVVVALLSIWLGLAANRDGLYAYKPHDKRGTAPPIVQTLAPRTNTLLGPRYVAAVWLYSFNIDALALLALDYPTEFRIPSVHGTSPFLWGPLSEALHMNDNGNFLLPRMFSLPADQTLDVLAAQYVGSVNKPITERVLWEDPKAIVSERPTALPPIRFVDRALCMDPPAILRELHRRKYDFADVALIDCASRPPLPELTPARTRAEVGWIDSAPGSLRLRVELGPDGPGMLILSQSDMPGWRARIDGLPSPIYRAYGLVQGLVVPAGVHEVELEYLPGSVVLGGRISLAALVVLLGVVAAGMWGRVGARRSLKQDGAVW